MLDGDHRQAEKGGVQRVASAVVTCGAAVLVALPFILAFFSGGYFAGPRLLAGIGACVLVVVAQTVARRSFPVSTPGRLTLAGLAALAAVVGFSSNWAPQLAPAQGELQLVLLYLAVLAAAYGLLQPAFTPRRLQCLLIGGTLIVVFYSLSARLFPGLVEQAASQSAAGRLEQPLTYWNALGCLASVGALLAVRIAGDGGMSRRWATASAASTIPLVLAAYLSFSRGALAVLCVGLVMITVLARSRSQALVVVSAVVLGGATCWLASTLHGFSALDGTLALRKEQGLIMSLGIIAAMAAISLIVRQIRSDRAERSFRVHPAWPAAVVPAAIVVLALAVSGVGSQDGQPRIGADNRRYVSVDSNRYRYWQTASRMFTRQPLRGEGSGSFRVRWRLERSVPDQAVNAHSLLMETGAELGLLGLLALGLFLGGSTWTVGRLVKIQREEAIGTAVALFALLAHALIDWDWQMPTLTIIALLLLASAMVAID